MKLLSKTLFLISSLGMATAAWSSPNQGGYLGLGGGVNFPTKAGASGTAMVALDAGAMANSNIGLGLYASYYGQTSSGSLLGLPSGAATTNYNIAGELNYFIGGMHLGFDVGVGIASWSGNISSVSASSSSTYFIFGPEAGFDISILPFLSIGAEVHALFNNNDSNVDNIQALAIVKVWL